MIDTANNQAGRSIYLGGPQTISANRRGERLFYNAKFAFQGQFSCANCHLDSTFDGMNWDLEPDGFGKDVVDNRSIEDISSTEPFKWNGGNPNLQTECGPRTEKFFYRSQSYNEQELADLDTYIFLFRFGRIVTDCRMDSSLLNRSVARQSSSAESHQSSQADS